MKSIFLILLLATITIGQERTVTLILGRDDVKCTAEDPFVCQRVVQMPESEALSEYARLKLIKEPTRDEQKMLSALSLSLGVEAAVREPQFEEEPVKRGVRRALQRKQP